MLDLFGQSVIWSARCTLLQALAPALMANALQRVIMVASSAA